MNPLRPIYEKVRPLWLWLKPMQIPLHCGRTSFFLILSLFPSLLLLLGLLRYTSYGAEELLELISGLLPPSLLGIAKTLVDASYRHSTGTVISVSAFAALWSASKGPYGLLEGLNAVYGAAEQRSYWRSRGISVIHTFFLLLALVLTLALHVFGKAVLDFLQMSTIPALLFFLRLIDWKLVLLLLLQTVLFTLLYAFLPSQRNRLRYSLPGALVVSLCWAVFSELFSIYVEYFTRYTNIFGSIYALVLGMLWLYCCISILFYGGAFNRWLAERKRKLGK